MALSFAALVYREEHVSERALTRGFAVALAGFAAPSPALTTAPLRAYAGWSVAFYSPGLRGAEASFRALEHATELFDEELPPGVAVRAAAGDKGTIYAIILSEDDGLDDVTRFDERGSLRWFVRDGDGGAEVGVESVVANEEEVATIEELEGEDDGGERTGTGLMARDLLDPRGRASVRAALAAAFFEADRRLPIALVEPTAEAVARETKALNHTLGRVDGRGAFSTDGAPPLYRAFAAAYDFADPKDPQDRYRELSIGRVKGTLRFLRGGEIDFKKRPFVFARLEGSALGGGGATADLALAGDGDELVILRDGKSIEAGPRLGELLRYLALGWASRSAFEEEEIGALMLRAHLRVEAP
jgi:hypothetical protein